LRFLLWIMANHNKHNPNISLDVRIVLDAHFLISIAFSMNVLGPVQSYLLRFIIWSRIKDIRLSHLEYLLLSASFPLTIDIFINMLE